MCDVIIFREYFHGFSESERRFVSINTLVVNNPKSLVFLLIVYHNREKQNPKGFINFTLILSELDRGY